MATEVTRPDYGEVTSYRPGDRIEIHPGCDLWMRGAKYGTVEYIGTGKVQVKMDHPQVRKLIWFPLDRVRPA